MTSSLSKKLQSLLVTGAVLLAAAPIGTAAAKDSGASASRAKASRVSRELKALRKQVAELTTRLSSLEGQKAPQGPTGPEGPRGVVGPPGPVGPPGSPGSLTGPAGGALTGTYPNPQLGPNVVASSNIVDGTIVGADVGPEAIQTANVATNSITGALIAPNTITAANIDPGTITSTEIANQSVGQMDLGPLSVGASQFGVIQRATKTVEIPSNTEGAAEATCPENTRMLSGGAVWQTENLPAMSLAYNGPVPSLTNFRSWEARGKNGTAAKQTLEVVALCLM